MERLALDEARRVEPPAELRDEVWKALEAAILPAAATAATVGALSEGASGGSHAAATVAGGKAAVGAATHMGLAVLPALKVVATAAIVLGSTAGVGFAVGRGWSALTQQDANEAPVEEAPRAAGPSGTPGASTPGRFSPGSPAAASAAPAIAAPTGVTPAIAAPASRASASAAVSVSEPPRLDNAGNADVPRAEALPAPGAITASPRAAIEFPRPSVPASASSAIGHAAAFAAQPTGSGAAMSASPAPARVVVGAPSAAPAVVGMPAPTGSARPSTGGAIYGADEESLVASEARQALRAGDPRRSLALLQRMEGLGGAGVLAEERGLLEIEALVRLGDRDSAREHARAFLQTWPGSVYAARVQAMLRGL